MNFAKQTHFCGMHRPAILRARCAVLLFVASASRGGCELPAKDAKAGVKPPTLAITGIISSTGAGLNKAGAGTLTLAAANTYQGSTTVSGGTLAVTGSLSGTTAVNVNGGGTLLVNSSTNSGNIFGSGNATAGGPCKKMNPKLNPGRTDNSQ